MLKRGGGERKSAARSHGHVALYSFAARVYCYTCRHRFSKLVVGSRSRRLTSSSGPFPVDATTHVAGYGGGGRLLGSCVGQDSSGESESDHRRFHDDDEVSDRRLIAFAVRCVGIVAPFHSAY